MDKDVLILAIESSCDETAAAVVKNGRDVLSNIIYSQIELHKLYGGVVPEIASRKHIEKINPVITAALEVMPRWYHRWWNGRKMVWNKIRFSPVSSIFRDTGQQVVIPMMVSLMWIGPGRNCRPGS